MRAAVALGALLVGPLAVACDDPLTPAEIAGQYTLLDEDGRNLPRLLSATLNCDVFLTGGVLVLNEDKSFALDLYQQIDCSRGGGPVQDAGRTYPGTFALSGNTIEFTTPRLGQPPITFSGTVSGVAVRLLIIDPDVSAWGQLKPTLRRLTGY